MTVNSKIILGNYLKIFKKPSEGELVVWIVENVAKVLCIRIHQEHAE